MRYKPFLTIFRVKAKVTFSDACASNILQLNQQEAIRFCGCGHAEPRRRGSGMGAPTFQKSLLPLWDTRGLSFNTAIMHDTENLELDFSLTCCGLLPVRRLCFVPSGEPWFSHFHAAGVNLDFAETRDLSDWEGTFMGAATSCDL